MAGTFVETKKVVKRVINGSGPMATFMSVVPTHEGSIDLVIGAQYEDKCACGLDAKGVGELIDTLKEIQEAM